MKTEHAIYFLIFFIPSYLLRFQLFGIPTNLWEVMMGIVFLIWIFSCWRGHGILNREYWGEWKQSFMRGSLAYFLFFGIFLLFVGLLVGTIISPEPGVSLGALKGWLVAPFLFGIMIYATLKEPHQQGKALWSLACSGLGVSLLAMMYWLLGDLTFDGRLRAFYESPNMLAMYVTPALLIVALELSSKVKIKSEKLQLKIQNVKRFLCVGALLLLATALLLTRSVGAIAALAVPLLLTIVSKSGTFLRWKYVVFFVDAFVAGGILLPFVSLLINPWTLHPSSLASRLMIWKSALSMARDYGMVGRGLGTFGREYLSYQANFPPYLEWAVPHPHNIFLGTLLAGGVLGILGMVFILFHVFKKFREQFSKHSVVACSAFFVLLYLLLHGTLDNTLWRGDMAIVFWFMLALL